MDAQRFDDLTKVFARRTSRRAVLRGAAGGGAVVSLVGADLRPAAAQTCGEGEFACDGVCVDLMTDLDNCGECGAVCESDLVAVDCIEGECVRTDCAAAQLSCDGECIDPSSDPNNCGDCGVVCESGECADSACVPADDNGDDDNGDDDNGGDDDDGSGGPTTLPDTGSGLAANRPSTLAPAALIAGAAALGAAALRRAVARPRGR